MSVTRPGFILIAEKTRLLSQILTTFLLKCGLKNERKPLCTFNAELEHGLPDEERFN